MFDDRGMGKQEDHDAVVEERRRHAQAVAAERSEGMESGFRHLLGNGERRAEERCWPAEEEPEDDS